MGCTKWSLATFITLGVAALLFIVGMGTDHIIDYKGAGDLYHNGLFTTNRFLTEDDWWKATQAMASLALILMAAAGVIYLIMLCCGCDCGRKFMLVLQGGVIYGAAAISTIGIIIFGANFENQKWNLGYSYYLMIVGAVGMYAAALFTTIDMIKGD